MPDRPAIRFRHAAGHHWATGKIITVTAGPAGLEVEVTHGPTGNRRTLTSRRHVIEVEASPGRWIPVEQWHAAPPLPLWGEAS